MGLHQSPEPVISHLAITSLSHLFKKSMNQKDDIFNWLKENIYVYLDLLIANFTSSDLRIQVTSFEKSIEICKIMSEKYNEFQNKIYLRIVSEILLLERISEQLQEAIHANLNEFDDLRFYFYRNTA